jgi:hypothetical protein
VKGKPGNGVRHDVDAAAFRFLRIRLAACRDQRFEVEGFAVDLDLSGIQSRHVEDIGDDAQQERPAFADVLAILAVAVVAERAEGA